MLDGFTEALDEVPRPQPPTVPSGQSAACKVMFPAEGAPLDQIVPFDNIEATNQDWILSQDNLLNSPRSVPPGSIDHLYY